MTKVENVSKNGKKRGTIQHEQDTHYVRTETRELDDSWGLIPHKISNVKAEFPIFTTKVGQMAPTGHVSPVSPSFTPETRNGHSPPIKVV